MNVEKLSRKTETFFHFTTEILKVNDKLQERLESTSDTVGSSGP